MTLYQGAAEHYVRGRRDYPAFLGEAIRDALGLDGTGRLLDVGCGPGKLTTLLAPHFAEAVGVDADPGMIEVAAANHPRISWHRVNAEDLPAGLGTFRCVTFAQSFHWMDQPLVAARVRDMIEPGGRWVHVAAQTHRGHESDVPWDRVEDLVEGYAGDTIQPGASKSGEEDVMRAAGYHGPERIVLPWGEEVSRSVDEVVSAVFSLSWAAPHLFGDDLPAFERDLRDLLGSGPYTERMYEIETVIWWP
ncbi:class I SAM-dependent methyltransferase [Actinoplanes sp. NPDC049265]|uniref:class I SAM-dependent methyltransferase n=1 Tax=Actinoplanes sp. NPDC049265 TaxID=3363902 RepID=UPI0037164623